MFPLPFLDDVSPQLGVRGTGRSAYMGPGSIAPLNVNKDHPNADDNTEGGTPDRPFATIQAALDAAVDFQTIYVHRAATTYSEELVVVAADAEYVNLVGIDFPVLEAPAGSAAPALLSANPINLYGLDFFNVLGGSDGAALVEIADVNVKVENCKFLGNDAEVTALSCGSASYGNWLIADNRFIGGGVTTTDALLNAADGINAQILRNLFTNYESVMNLDDFQNALIQGNLIGLFATTGLVEASAAPGAQVSGNYFGGTYSIAGGYTADADSHWIGNFIAGGVTTADPA